VAKVLVPRRARGRGIGATLMQAAEGCWCSTPRPPKRRGSTPAWGGRQWDAFPNTRSATMMFFKELVAREAR